MNFSRLVVLACSVTFIGVTSAKPVNNNVNAGPDYCVPDKVTDETSLPSKFTLEIVPKHEGFFGKRKEVYVGPESLWADLAVFAPSVNEKFIFTLDKGVLTGNGHRCGKPLFGWFVECPEYGTPLEMTFGHKSICLDNKPVHVLCPSDVEHTTKVWNIPHNETSDPYDQLNDFSFSLSEVQYTDLSAYAGTSTGRSEVTLVIKST
ncbi:hypothetical protein B0J14DRAFT_674658 [Halenospora varia]|nr:hypothetical protein B0J14DRAFT_674658 [Halenospora varia]